MKAPRVKPPKTTSSDPIQSSPLALQPESLQAFLRLYGVLWSRGVVDQATKEVARIRNARRIDCPICKAIRFAGARREGLTDHGLSKIAVALGGLPDEIPVHEQPTPDVPLSDSSAARGAPIHRRCAP